MKAGLVALILSAVALGIAAYSLTRKAPRAQRAPIRTDRVDALERQVAKLNREIESLKAMRPRPVRRETFGLPAETTGVAEGASPADVAEDRNALEAAVDAAVDKKTKRVLNELKIKENKKPSIDVFAKMLELTPEQRAATERVVIDGQNRMHALLNTPTQDGTNLMDGLVDLVAKGFAQPGKDHGWGRWVARIMSETIPGTNESYGTRIESVKNDMRASFKHVWSAAQYKEFEAWGVDPTEIEKVPGSPNEQLAERVMQRAREFGAAIPDK